jgi:hypothetical protein
MKIIKKKIFLKNSSPIYRVIFLFRAEFIAISWGKITFSDSLKVLPLEIKGSLSDQPSLDYYTFPLRFPIVSKSINLI